MLSKKEKELYKNLKSHPDIIAYKRKRTIHTLNFAFVVILLSIICFRSGFREINILSEFLFIGTVLFIFLWVSSLLKKPKIVETSIVQILPYKSIWLNPNDGHKYEVLINKVPYLAECLHGRASGTESFYEINESVYFIQFSNDEYFIIKK